MFSGESNWSPLLAGQMITLDSFKVDAVAFLPFFMISNTSVMVPFQVAERAFRSYSQKNSLLPLVIGTTALLVAGWTNSNGHLYFAGVLASALYNYRTIMSGTSNAETHQTAGLFVLAGITTDYLHFRLAHMIADLLTCRGAGLIP